MDRRQFALVVVVVVVSTGLGAMLSGCLLGGPQKTASTTGPKAEGSSTTQTSDAQGVVETQAIRLVDSQGRVRMEMRVDSDDSCGCEMFDPDGKRRLAWGLDDHQDPWIGMYDKQHTERVLLRCGKEQPELLIMDPQQGRAVEVAYYTNGPGIVINKGKDDHRLVMGTDLSGRTYLSMYDANAERIELDVAAEDGSPTIHLGDGKGKTIWRAP